MAIPPTISMAGGVSAPNWVSAPATGEYVNQTMGDYALSAAGYGPQY